MLKKFFSAVGANIKEIGTTFAQGDAKTRLSYLILGLGPLLRGQTVKGLAYLACELSFIWYMITNLAYSDRSNQFVDYMRYELDAGICAVIMYPLARIIGRRRMKYLFSAMLHLILAFCTVTICVMMFNFFTQRELTLPNGLTVYGKKNGSVYFGVNQNLAAMIGVTMTYVCVFLFIGNKLLTVGAHKNDACLAA